MSRVKNETARTFRVVGLCVIFKSEFLPKGKDEFVALVNEKGFDEKLVKFIEKAEKA